MTQTNLFAAALVTVAVSGTTALGAFNLQITEIWSGNEPGANLTEDWFEVTNFGDMAWTEAADGKLYYDDDSQDFAVADPINFAGPATIAPGESVVFIDGGPAGANDWFTLWGDDIVLPAIGEYSGSGLSQSGDGATLFLDADMNGVDAGDIIDFESYPDANTAGGGSFDVYNGIFSHPSYAAITNDVNNAGQPAIATPGYLAEVPEPGAIVLLLMGTAIAALRIRLA